MTRAFLQDRRAFLRNSGAALLGACAARRAAADAAAPLRFGAGADIQYCDCDAAGSRYYRDSLEKAAACAGALSGEGLAFVVHLGDFIDRDFTSFPAALAALRGLTAPLRHVLGNHDFSVEETRKAQVPEVLSMPRRYYHFSYAGWRFLVLDGNDISFHGRTEGSPQQAGARRILDALEARKAVNAQTWNGAVGEEQMAWLDAALAEAGARQQRAIVFCHFPVYPEDAHNLWNDTQIVELLESHPCVAAYINGHNHAGNYGEKAGIHYLTLQGMVETPDIPAFAAISLHPDRIEVNGFGREPNRVLAICGA